MKRKLLLAALCAVIAGAASVAGLVSSSSAAPNRALAGTIKVWIMDPGDTQLRDVLTAQARRFEGQHAGTNVDLRFVGWGAGHQQITTAIASGETPDVAELGTTWTGEFASTGAVQSIGKVAKGRYVASLVDSGSVRGTAYGYPWYAGARALLYRKDLLARVGAKKAPATWNELLALGQKLKKKVKGVYPFGITGTYTVPTVLPLIWQFGGNVAIFKNGRWVSRVNSPQAVAGLSFYGKLFKLGFAPRGALTKHEGHVRSDFAAGNVAMAFGGGWDYNSIIQTNPSLKGKIGVALAPAGPGGNRDMFAGGSHLVVFKRSSQKTLARQFIEFLVAPRQMNEWVTKIGFLPGTTASIKGSGWLKSGVYGAFARQLMNHSRVMPKTPTWGKLEVQPSPIDGAVQRILKGESAKKVLDGLARTMDRTFAG